MNVFEENYINGYTKHEKHFNKWAERASILGDIKQCFIVELDSSGHAFIASNRPDIGEESLSKRFFNHEQESVFTSFFQNPIQGISTFTSQIGYENSDIYIDKCKLTGIAYRDVINKDTQRCYCFLSDTPQIFDKIIQNIDVVEKLLKFFKMESEKVINYYGEHKFHLAAESTNYFKKNCDIEKTSREKMNALLQDMGILDQHFTKREWQCIEIMRFGKSANETGIILGISGRTVEGHFEAIKKKLKINAKAKILETIN